MSLDIERSPLNFYVVEIMQMSHPPQDIKKVTEGELKLIKGIYKKNVNLFRKQICFDLSSQSLQRHH